MVEKSELRKQLRSADSQRERVKSLAAENAELKMQVKSLKQQQKSRQELKNGLLKQLRRIPNLRRCRAPLQGAQRKNFLLWQRRTVILLEQAFGEDSDPVKEFQRIEYEPSYMITTPADDYARGMDDAEVFLKITIERLES